MTPGEFYDAAASLMTGIFVFKTLEDSSGHSLGGDFFGDSHILWRSAALLAERYYFHIMYENRSALHARDRPHEGTV